MPYEGQRSNYEPIRRLVQNRRINEMLSKFRTKPPPQDENDYPDNLYTITADDLQDTWNPTWILSVDGGRQTTEVQNGYPDSEAEYVTVASVLLHAKRLKELDAERPIEPKVLKSTKRPESIDGVLPGRNVLYRDALTVRESLRHVFFELFEDNKALDGDETLLDTYEALLPFKPAKPTQRCPFTFDDNCISDEEFYRPAPGRYACPCEHGRTLYSTDALRIHERFAEWSTNERIYSEVGQVLEALWIVHILRCLEAKTLLASLGKLAIMLDGPLAVFGQPAWLSGAISQELQRIDKIVCELTGQHLMLIGIEKTGPFMTHFIELDRPQNGKRLEPGTLILLTDHYIKRYINPSESIKPYGANTYYGRKLMYKTRRHDAHIVATVPYLNDGDDDWRTASESQFPRLRDVLNLLDSMVSTQYPDSLMPIIAAHSEASIPLNLGKKVLEQLARELMQDNG